ncbi:hypothetical protein [Candidatus Neptunochlamydia vexilliferae]|nr:hypothetical protein [Candidatus Neptunochlamydia vexilliferae]
MKQQTTRAIVKLSNFGYVAACIVLYLIALCILGSAVWSIVSDMLSGTYTVYNILDEVGLIVFAMAVIDVGKYLMLEEVIRKGPKSRPQSDTRKTIGKFGIIIVSALSLEGLVLTIEVAKQDISKIHYPVSVLLTATFFIMGIGVYQLLSARSETKREPQD